MNEEWLALNETVWVHKNQKFHKAIVRQIYKDIVTCLLENTDVIKAKKHDVFQRNPMPHDAARTDLMETDLINEPEILYTLRLRFEDKKIYTFVENTLIAINPYKMIPQLYTDQSKNYYIHKLINNNQNMKDHEPHLYSITAAMLSALKTERMSQAIVISGQSGAGKTEANKQCLRFLGSYFKEIHGSKQSKIQKAIMQSNPVLQAFGNSKTIRNNNSSRFGKYLNIMLDQNDTITHAQIYNYLLQKSRIISRPSEEQNFHIFYEFLSKTTKAEKFKYCLLDDKNKEMSFNSFKYVKNDKNNNGYLSHPDVSFEKVKESLAILPDKNSYDYACKILSAVLHLGNLQPYEDESLDRCEIIPQASFANVCNLLSLNEKLLTQALTSYSIKIGGQDLVKSFSKREVQELIHSLSKTLYQKLFQWIINEINLSTAASETSQKMLSIGFLDIYGFEVLKENSLEQMFINYTNERLHQIYLSKIFKLEKQCFRLQNLQHKFKQVNFQDNMKVLELMDYDNLSIFNLLDEWCSVASPDQSTFITKLRFNHKKHEKFPPQNFNLISTQFMIKHTPQNVEYSVIGFRQKNKDLLREQIKLTMRSSKLPILQQMFDESNLQMSKDPSAHRVRKFLSSKFRKQMNMLTDDILQKCSLHFIRCIKSNSKKEPMMIEDEVMYSQIKYLGILDTIKIKKMGYCIKVKYENIDRRFSWVVRDNYLEPSFSHEIKKNLSAFVSNFSEQQMLFGVSKVFFRDFAYSVLLKKYSKYLQYLNQMAHRITSLLVFNRYKKVKERKHKNSSIICNYLRSAIINQKYQSKIRKILSVQKQIRKFLGYKIQAKKLESVATLQAYIRRTIAVNDRLHKINCAQKIIRFMRRAVIRRKAQKSIFIASIVKKDLYDRVWEDICEKRAKIIKRYLKGATIQIKGKQKISKANLNERLIIKQKATTNVRKYLLGLKQQIYYQHYLNTVVKGQNLIKAWILRRRFVKLRKAAIVIQRAWRDYLFKRKGAKTMFNQLYRFYEDELLHQNLACQSQLYDTQNNSAEEITGSIKRYLGKFRDKISLLYWMIDFESFVDLALVYEGNSWIWNYLQIYKESLEKDNPIQYLQVGETFTVVANTNKLYMWGMHEKYKITGDMIVQLKSKNSIEYIQVNKNQLTLSHQLAELKNFRIASTVSRDYNLENAKLFQCHINELKLITAGNNEKVVEISCGKGHTILRTFSKKVYSFGLGKEGQLGHSSYNYEEKPRLIRFFETIKTAQSIQVSAAFNSSVVLLSNKKIYWFGTNGTIKKVHTPTLLDLRSKSEIFTTSEFVPIRLIASWSRTMSVIGVTILCYNGKFSNNAALKNRTTDVLISKWQQHGLQLINPPIAQGVCDHLQQCHVRLPKRKVQIDPPSKKILKQMEEKVRSVNPQMSDISFANTQRNSIFK